MSRQALFVGLLTLVVGACSAGTVSSDTAPLPAILYSEFASQDEDSSFYGPFLAATQAQHNADFAKSADFYLEALAADPDSEFVAGRAFFQLLYGGRTEKAADIAEQIMKRGLKKKDDLVRLMYVLKAYKAQNWPEVRVRLEGNFSSGFGKIFSPLLLAWSYGAEGDLPHVRQALAPLMADKRMKSIAQEHIAYILDHMGHFEDANAQYGILTSIDPPATLQPAVAYAYMQHRQGNTEKARTFLISQIKRFRGNGFLMREGQMIENGGRPTQVPASPQGAIGMVFLRLATEFSQGQSSQAAILYSRIASYLTPEVSDIYFLLGDMLEEEGHMDAAAAAYNQVPVKSPMRPLADLHRIGALQAGSHKELAEQLIRRKLEKAPRDSRMLRWLARILRQRGDFKDAISYYDKAINEIKTPKLSDWEIYFVRGVTHQEMGNWPAAEADMKKALEISPAEPDVLNHLGYSWIEKGEHILAAKKMIERAAMARPNDGAITDSLGWIYYLTGEYEAAVLTLEKAVQLEPDDITINDHLGDSYWRVGRKIEARFQWRHAIDSGAEGEMLATLKAKIEDGLPKTAIRKPN